MPYITREDGKRFVIPSYRDVLSAKKTSLLKREIMLLSANYGEYITLQRKNVEQYEVAFSNEQGYLLGETVWHYFKRPFDLIYCEEIPNTTEAILVIVKSGSVYLDGAFPIDSIPEELIIFKSQQNNFNIYINGNVPISEKPEDGKFWLDASSVRSFTILDEPLFPTLPTVKTFQLQLVDTVLRAQGIGVFPVRQLVTGIIFLGLLWMAWNYITTHKKELPQVIVGVVNPYQIYINTLTSPDPSMEFGEVLRSAKRLFEIPGWYPEGIEYSKGKIVASVKSEGARTAPLFEWAKLNQAQIQAQPEGFYVIMPVYTTNRPMPNTINELTDVIANIVDRLSFVMSGNNLQVGPITDRKAYSETELTVSFNMIPLTTLDLIGQQFKDLPLVLNKVTIKANRGVLTGSIMLQALGN